MLVALSPEEIEVIIESLDFNRLQVEKSKDDWSEDDQIVLLLSRKVAKIWTVSEHLRCALRGRRS